MSASEIDRTLVRLAHEVVEKNEGLDRLAIIGIHRRRAVLGERLADRIGQLEGLRSTRIFSRQNCRGGPLRPPREGSHGVGLGDQMGRSVHLTNGWTRRSAPTNKACSTPVVRTLVRNAIP